MEVILKEDVAKLGSRGDVVKVAEGYGRNFLLPRKLAIEASAGNKKVIEQMRAASVRRSAKEKAQAEAIAKQQALIQQKTNSITKIATALNQEPFPLANSDLSPQYQN